LGKVDVFVDEVHEETWIAVDLETVLEITV